MLEENKSIIVDDRLNRIRELYNNVQVDTTDLTDSLLAQIYTAARKCKVQNITNLALTLNWSNSKLQYYKETFPEVATIIQLGFVDGRADMEEKLTKTLYDSAVGNHIIVDEQVDEDEIIDFKTGIKTGTKRKIKTITKRLPPNPNAALELLKRINPADWNVISSVVNNNYNTVNFNAVDDINVKVDYRKLSPETIAEIIESEKGDGSNIEVNKTEDGVTLSYLKEYREKQANKVMEKPEDKPKRGRPKKVEEPQPLPKKRGRPKKIKIEENK